MCKRFTGGWADPVPVETFPGEGLSPFTPMVKAPFVNADGRLFTANAPEYSQSADAIWLRKTVNKREKAIRTARGESAFDSAQFVAMEENGQVGGGGEDRGGPERFRMFWPSSTSCQRTRRGAA